MERFATVNWKGSGKEGRGHVTSRSGAVNSAFFTAGSRFEEDPGTNPEELIASAHASCFTMKLAFVLSNAGFTAENLDTRCDIKFNKDKTEIASSHLTVKGRVPGISKEKFDELVEDARKNCPVSLLLKAEITVDSILEEDVLA